MTVKSDAVIEYSGSTLTLASQIFALCDRSNRMSGFLETLYQVYCFRFSLDYNILNSSLSLLFTIKVKDNLLKHKARLQSRSAASPRTKPSLIGILTTVYVSTDEILYFKGLFVSYYANYCVCL